MPMIELTLPEGSLDDESTAALVERLSHTTAKWVGASDFARVAATVWAYVAELPGDAVYVGGRRADQPRYRIRVTVGQGALDAPRKEGLVADLTQHVLDAEGTRNEPANAARVWCHVHELPDGNWGAAGRIWSLEEIARFGGLTLPSAPAHAPAGAS